MRMPLIPLALVLAVAAPRAMPAEDVVWTSGVGTLSCGKWLELRPDGRTREQFVQWVYGYVSAHNYYYAKATQIRLTDSAGALAFIDRYCRDNPLHFVASAGAALVQELGGAPALHEWRK